MKPPGLPWATTAVAAGEEAIQGGSLVWLTFVIAASAVALLACGVLSARRTLHPNPLAGIRTAFTMDSARNWYAVHDRAAPVFTGSGLFFALSIVPLFLFDSLWPQVWTQLGLLGAGTAVLVVGTIRAQRAAKQALAEEDAREDALAEDPHEGEERER
ncbi:SdpI family protein [Nocardiopsis xinjiangensis]|uniref:SdpI family protein n=1 Tax=Nocardiopsis xinjiangensis TaxID=124285 RepID=UPI00034959AE|nr:SdpI family protein [Nocardiopsis xinjiangensis]